MESTRSRTLPGPGLSTSADAGHGSRSRAVVAVLAVTGGVALAINQRTSAAADVAGSGSPSLTPTDVPDGWRLVSNEGLEVGIPKLAAEPHQLRGAQVVNPDRHGRHRTRVRAG